MLATISGCGVAFLDSPSEIIAFILNYLGKNTSSYNIQDYILAINVLRNISPHIASFSSAKYTANWVNGDACLVVGYSGDLITYKRKAENKNLKFTIPKEGSILILDGLTILNDASNKNAAHNFINYMIDPEIAKENLLYNKTFSALDAKYLGDRQPVEIKLINDDYFKKLRVMHKRPQHIENMINFEWQKLMSLR
jgi:putrescine transport system substrate-binding protein